MNVFNHPTLEAHRLACVELIRLMNADWYEVPKLRALRAATNPWNRAAVDEALQALYRPRYTVHFRGLTGQKRTQDCPADYLSGFRAIVMAQVLEIDVFQDEERRGLNAASDDAGAQPASI